MQLIVLLSGLSLASAAALPQNIINDLGGNSGAGVQPGSDPASQDFQIPTSGRPSVEENIDIDFSGQGLGDPSGPGPDGFSDVGPDDLDFADSQFSSLASTGAVDPATVAECKEGFSIDFPNVS